MKQNSYKLYKLILLGLEDQKKEIEKEVRKLQGQQIFETAFNEANEKLNKILSKIEKLHKWYNEECNKELETWNKLTMRQRIDKIGFTLFGQESLYIDKNGMSDYLLASIIEYYFPMVHFGDFYLFDCGIYVRVTELEPNNAITKLMFKNMNCGIKREVLDRLKTWNNVTEYEYKEMFLSRDVKYINFKNCYIEFKIDKGQRLTKEFEIKKHNPNIFFNIQVPINFNEKRLSMELESKTPAFNQYLETTFNDDTERNLFNEFSGSCLLHTNYTEKMVFARGDGGNGKGTWDRLLKLIFKNYYCNPDGNEMTDINKRNQFYGLEFIDSYVGFVTEINKNIKDMSFVKKFSGNDEINIQLKNRNQRMKFLPPTKIIFSLNNTAKIYETEEAIKRRVIFLSMNNKFQKDKTLEPRMKNEIEFIFYRFFNSLLSLIERDCQFVLPNSHKDLAKICWESNNDFTNFIVNHVNYNPDCKGISKKAIFDMMNNEYGNKFVKHKSNFYNLLEAELNNNDIKPLIKKARMDNYVIVNNEIILDENSKQTSVTLGYVNLEFVDSKVEEVQNERKIKTIYRLSNLKQFEVEGNIVLPYDSYFYIENNKPILIENLSDFLKVQVTLKEDLPEIEQQEILSCYADEEY